MFTAKDGKKFGSSFAGKRYDDAHSEDGMHKLDMEPEEEKESPKMEEEENKQGEEKENEGDEHPVVAEHGKAHTVHIKHHEGGKSHVMSHHPDGHTHMSEHADMAEAHEEGMKLAGAQHGQQKEEKSPYMQGKDQQGASSEEDGFAMPDLV